MRRTCTTLEAGHESEMSVNVKKITDKALIMRERMMIRSKLFYTSFLDVVLTLLGVKKG